jgi:hypothetical protein
MPRSSGAYPPVSAESGAFGAQAYGQHDGPRPQQEGYPEYGGLAHPVVPHSYPGLVQPPRRPGLVVAGCVMAWLGSTLGLLSGFFFVSLTEDSAVFDDLDMGMSRADAVTLFQITGAFLIVWCLAVAVMAVFAFRGARWAAIALQVMAVVMALVSIANWATSGSPQGAFGMVWALASAALIYQNRPAKDWFAAMTAARRRGSASADPDA